jgi:hypothetical protein
VTSSEVQVLETRLDSFEKKIGEKLESVIRLEEGVKHVVESLKGCPMCKNTVTAHDTQIEALKDEITGIKNNLDQVWKRLWAFAWVAVTSIVAVGGGVAVYALTH